MGYKIVINADFVKDYQLQSARRIKIAEDVTNCLGWKEKDRIFELVDKNNRVVILVKREDFEKLLKDGTIEIVD